MTSHSQPNRFKRSPKAAPKYCEFCGEEIRVSVGENGNSAGSHACYAMIQSAIRVSVSENGNSAGSHACYAMIQSAVPRKQRPIQKEKLIIDKIDKGDGRVAYIARNKAVNSDYPNGYGPIEVIIQGKISIDPVEFWECSAPHKRVLRTPPHLRPLSNVSKD
jgi:hypothetical protein